MQCPKCGSSPKEVQYREPLTMWVCETTCGPEGDTRFVIEGIDCLRNQLAQRDARIAELEKKYTNAVGALWMGNDEYSTEIVQDYENNFHPTTKVEDTHD